MRVKKAKPAVSRKVLGTQHATISLCYSPSPFLKPMSLTSLPLYTFSSLSLLQIISSVIHFWLLYLFPPVFSGILASNHFLFCYTFSLGNAILTHNFNHCLHAKDFQNTLACSHSSPVGSKHQLDS